MIRDIQCGHCKHLDLERGTCKAFPDITEEQKTDPWAIAIPDELWYGDFIHDKPYPGDHGVRFEEIEYK